MPKNTPPIRKKPSAHAVRRAIASSTALATGQDILMLEKKLEDLTKLRFQHVKLAA